MDFGIRFFGNETRLLKSKREWGGRGVKEKNVVEKPGSSSPMLERVTVSTDSSGLQDENVDCPTNTPASAVKMDGGTMVSDDATNIRTDLNISEAVKVTSTGPTASVSCLDSVSFATLLKGDLGRKDSMLENGPWFIRNNPLILKKWNPDVNLMNEDVGNVPVWVKLHGVPVTAFSKDGLSAIATKLGQAMLEHWLRFRADVELKDNMLVALPKLVGRSSIHVMFMLSMNGNLLDVRVVRGVLVGLKVGFKPLKQVYRQVYKKNNVNTSSNKKKDSEPTIEVSNSNLFDVLNLVENDVDLGINNGTSNLASKKAKSSGPSF
ncbi:reverse transcriptase domain-containing protein [Tanacetum coccineum]